MDSSSDLRSLTVRMNSEADMKKLSSNDSQLQVSMGIMKDNEVTFNTIWQTIMLAPVTVIQWKPVFGFNWTESVADDGVAITAGSEWKQCNFGQVLDIDEDGYLVDSDIIGDPSMITIGQNNYKAQAKAGINILIGIQKEYGEFHPIYIDLKGTGVGVGNAFQPTETLQWWYESGAMRSTMIITSSPPKTQADFSKPDEVTQTFKKESTFYPDSATWITNPLR